MKINEPFESHHNQPQLDHELYFLIYLSNAVKACSDEYLKQLLVTSRKNNLERNITGLLLDNDGSFMHPATIGGND